ncbi:hypothetical protein OG225_14860 [Nocardia sp. NBC_01377]|uniref:hypothetical protein n=1 Tax=Nocardia sp. NBC_01377 TaxID=2903595 RepID=UPI003249FBA3
MPGMHRLYRRAPILRRLVEKTLWLMFELVTAAFWKWPRAMRLLERRHATVLADTVTDLATRRALTPDYRAGCKRILISSTYHAGFNRDDVRLETVPITAVDTGGIRTADDHHGVDVIICGTGFETDTFVATMTVTGRDGVSLHERWSDGATAFLTVSPEEPAEMLVRLATDAEGGRYFYRGAEETPTEAARDDEAAARLWIESGKLLADLGFQQAPHPG